MTGSALGHLTACPEQAILLAMATSSPSFLKSLVLGALNRAGYGLIKIPEVHTGQLHADVTPYASYSPWNVDQEFQEIYNRVKGFTLVDLYKCYELWQLVPAAARLGGSMIEVGAWRGGSAALIAARAKSCGSTARIYVCDTFRGVVKAGSNDDVYVGGEHADTSRAEVEELFQNIGLENTQILQGIFPDDTGQDVINERFSLCHIDVDVYESARDAVAWLDERMIPGGMFIYDDYGFINTSGVCRFVEEQRELPDRVVVHNLNGHAVVIKLS